MNLCEVTNGWFGESYVRVYVVAPNESKALDLAREKYRAEAESRPVDEREKYYSDLGIELILKDVSKEQVSEVFD